jgi:hypothetical protein
LGINFVWNHSTFVIGMKLTKEGKTMGFGKIKAIIHLLVFVLLILPAIPMAAFALPAFPGAEGFGSDTIGGRSASAKLCKVNSLADTTTGSCNPSGDICTGTARYCLADSNVTGPKIVIFTVGGTVTLGSSIVIRESHTTVAGQTAPGGGILFRGPNIGGGGGATSIIVAADDVIVRGLRVRDTGRSAFGIASPPAHPITQNVIVDHNSFSWGNDEVINVGDEVHDFTFSWNIISEGTAPHGCLMALFGKYTCTRDTGRGSIHHNLLAHPGTMDRAPIIKHDMYDMEVINNVMYNWYWGATRAMSPTYISRNNYIAGANTLSGESQKGVQVHNAGECPQLPTASVMVSHNIGTARHTDTGDDWDIVQGGTSIYRTNTPYFTLSGISEDVVTDIENIVLAGAGATQPTRDSVDIRIVNDVTNLTGGFINSPSDVGGWPTIASGTYPTDTDGDGMPDSWETARGLDPNSSADMLADQDGDGYLNIEEYINSFFPAIGSPLPPPRVLIPNPPSIIGVN